MNHITEQGLNLVRLHEGFCPKPYLCPTGHLTIGYGHVIKPEEHFTLIQTEEAESLLRQDMEVAGKQVKALVKVPLNDDQYSALASWLFNLGNTPAVRESTLLKYLNTGHYHLVPGQFGQWVIGTVGNKPTVLPGLIKRRAQEALLFISKWET